MKPVTEVTSIHDPFWTRLSHSERCNFEAKMRKIERQAASALNEIGLKLAKIKIESE